MLDVVYIALTIAIFAVVFWVAKGVEKLGPRAGGSAHHPVMGREEQG